MQNLSDWDNNVTDGFVFSGASITLNFTIQSFLEVQILTSN